MNNLENKLLKIEALKGARHYVEVRKAKYICIALDYWCFDKCSSDIDYNSDKWAVASELRKYINKQLEGYGAWGYERWLEKKGHIPHARDAHRGEGIDKIRRSRIAWIDWMIACLEEDVAKLKGKK